MAATWTPENETTTTWQEYVPDGTALLQSELLIGGGYKLLIDNGSYYLIIQPARNATTWTAEAES